VIQPWALLVAAPVFVATLLLSGYMSLGSLFGCAALPIGVLLAGLVSSGTIDWAEFLYATIGAGIVWYAHSDNIDRLLNGTERRRVAAGARAENDEIERIGRADGHAVRRCGCGCGSRGDGTPRVCSRGLRSRP
jgi:hypothetical protein